MRFFSRVFCMHDHTPHNALPMVNMLMPTGIRGFAADATAGCPAHLEEQVLADPPATTEAPQDGKPGIAWHIQGGLFPRRRKLRESEMAPDVI